LNIEEFGSLTEARIVIEDWRNEYNTWRPHSSLGGLTPAQYATNWTPKNPRTTPITSGPTDGAPSQGASPLSRIISTSRSSAKVSSPSKRKASNQGRRDVKLFEIGRVFEGTGEGKRPAERESLAIVMSGSIAAEDWRGRRPIDFYCELCADEELGVSVVSHIGNEENVQAILQHPAHVVGSDGILVGDLPHPRGWGTHVRFLAHYVRDMGLLTWEEGVRHMTSAPAQRLGFLDRGLLKPGGLADLVVFDPATLRDTATYEQPRSFPTGVSHVAVNGKLVIEGGQPTGATPGQALRSPFGRTPERIAGPLNIQG